MERNLLMVGSPLITDPRREQSKWRAAEKKTRTGTTKSHPIIYNYQSRVSNHSGKWNKILQIIKEIPGKIALYSNITLADHVMYDQGQ